MKTLVMGCGVQLLFPVLLFASVEGSSTPAAVIAAEAACESLAGLSLKDAKILSASSVPAGSFTTDPIVTAEGEKPLLIDSVPGFCRVKAVLAPSADSRIRVEVWLPLAGWNGKFMGVGNGGWAGAISYRGMLPALIRGYAVASTVTGHQSTGLDGSFAIGHPEKQIDFGGRAVHLMTVQGQAITSAFYGAPLKRSYWIGCSSGGKQGMKEAQSYPQDYDGIIAGAPAAQWTHLMTQGLSLANAVHEYPGSRIPDTKYPLLAKAVLARCDALDGVEDGLLEDPRRCAFDPAELECKGVESDQCLTTPQVAMAKKIYASLRNPRSGEEIFPGLAYGTELRWGGLAGRDPFPIPVDHFRYVVFGDPGWDFRTFDVDRDLAKAEEIDANVGGFEASNPNLTAFRERGGKLLHYMGWSDELIAAESAIRYWESVAKHMGDRGNVNDFYRLFMVPGMYHCGGGEGATDQFDPIGVLERWVEGGAAPDRILAANLSRGGPGFPPVVTRTRPLCPYPQVAGWNGSGSTDDATNFECLSKAKAERR